MAKRPKKAAISAGIVLVKPLSFAYNIVDISERRVSMMMHSTMTADTRFSDPFFR